MTVPTCIEATACRFQPMLAVDAPEDLAEIRYPVLVQPKLNGVRACQDSSGLVSREGHRLSSPSGLAPVLAALGDCGLDGELYRHGLPLEEISGAARTLGRPCDPLAFHVFDLADGGAPFRERARRLLELPAAGPLAIVPATWASGPAQVETLYQDFLAAGYEGIILRDPDAPYAPGRCGSLLRRKPFLDEEATVLDLIEGSGRLAGSCGAVVIRGRDGWTCRVGTGMDDALRRRWWSDPGSIIGQAVTVRYQSRTRRGVPFLPRFANLRLEVCLD